jgi:hypothetical protein
VLVVGAYVGLVVGSKVGKAVVGCEKCVNNTKSFLSLPTSIELLKVIHYSLRTTLVVGFDVDGAEVVGDLVDGAAVGEFVVGAAEGATVVGEVVEVDGCA